MNTALYCQYRTKLIIFAAALYQPSIFCNDEKNISPFYFVSNHFTCVCTASCRSAKATAIAYRSGFSYIES
jgi:hypothetical protein